MGKAIQNDDKIGRLQTELSRAEEDAEELKKGQNELAAILARTPLFMMVVDEERRVRKVSDAVLKFTNRVIAEVMGLRGGEALRCVHHLDDPNGCGYGPKCRSCTVRRTVQDTLETGKSYEKVEASLSFIEDAESERSLLISTTLIENPAKRVLVFVEDVTERKKAEAERERLIQELQKALAEVKKLSGLLPICASCNKIRDDKGYWNRLETFIQAHSEAQFSHSVCPDCARKLYPELKIGG